MGKKAGITKGGDQANFLVDCHFCEGVGLHFGKDCGACDGTGEERVRKQKQKLYNAKNNLPINHNLNYLNTI